MSTTLFQRILVPLDGSPRAELILPHVADVMEREASELLLVQAVSSDYETSPLLACKRDDAKSYLQGVARRTADPGGRIRTRVLEGSPAGAILGAAAQEGATMIAMTTHGRTGVMRWLLGGVAARVLRASEVPVLLVNPSSPANRPALEGETPRKPPFRRILIATDGSATSMAVVEPALQFAAPFGSEIVALHVWDSFVLDDAPLIGMEAGRTPSPEAPLSREDEVTARVARQAGPSGLKVTRVTRTGDTASEILDHSLEQDVDLIALVTRSRRSLSRWMTGSVAERVLRSTAVPLLVVRVAAEPAILTRHG